VGIHPFSDVVGLEQRVDLLLVLRDGLDPLGSAFTRDHHKHLVHSGAPFDLTRCILTDVAVVVPLHGDCPYRERAWKWVRARYAERHPDWKVVEARLDAEPWCKAQAVNPAVAECDLEIVVISDADVWTDGLGVAVAAVEAGAPWAIPHTQVHRLDETGTAAVLAGADWVDQPLAQRAYKGIEGGGVAVAPREVLTSVPLDERFVGWGQEDECHALALRTLAGKPWRGRAALVHMFHPPQPRMTRRRGSEESWELRKRYFAAAKDPSALRALIEESRVDREPDQSPMHDHSPV
jgi:hypothetical protein